MEGIDEGVYRKKFSSRNFVHLNEVANLYETTYTYTCTEYVPICTRKYGVITVAIERGNNALF